MCTVLLSTQLQLTNITVSSYIYIVARVPQFKRPWSRKLSSATSVNNMATGLRGAALIILTVPHLISIQCHLSHITTTIFS